MSTEQNANHGWEDRSTNKKPQNKEAIISKDEWVKWKPGQNPVRALSAPHTYFVHTLPELSTDPTKPQKIKCSDPEGFLRYKNKEIKVSEIKCPICRKAEPYLPKTDSSMSKDEVKKIWKAAFEKIRLSGYEPKARWYIAAIVRNANNMIQVCDIGSPIYDGIKTLVDNKKWGNPLEYDIVVNVNKNAAPANYYMVTPEPKEPLTASEIQMKDEFDFTKLERACVPPTEESVTRRIDWLLSQKDKSQPVREKAPEPTTHEGSTDSAMEFPQD